MTLRRKIHLSCLSAVLAACALVLAGARGVLLEYLASIELEEVRADMRRVEAISEELLDAMMAMASAYGTWDDACSFLEKPNEAFIRANFSDASFQILQLEVVVMTGGDGRVVYAQGYDLAQKSFRPVPKAWMATFTQYGLFSPNSSPDAAGGSKGIVAAPEGPIMFVTKPVLDTNGTGPPRGRLLMGRPLGAADINALSRMSLTRVSWLALDDLPEGTFHTGPAAQSGEEGGPVPIMAHSGDSIVGLHLMRDIRGVPVGAWRIDKDRHIFAKGLDGIMIFAGACAAGFMLIAFGFCRALGAGVADRIDALATRVSVTIPQADPAVQAQQPGQDEIARLSGSLDVLFGRMERAQCEREETNTRARAALAAARAQLCALTLKRHALWPHLNTMLDVVALLRMEPVPARAQELLEDMQRVCVQLLDLAGSSPGIAGLQSGQLQVARDPVALSGLLEQVVGLMRSRALAKGIALRLETRPDLPESVWGDALRLEQVLSGLLDAAVSLTNEGSVVLRAKSGACAGEPDAVLFEVEDCSAGASAAVLDALNASLPQEGDGAVWRPGAAGMVLAHRLLELMGSRLEGAAAPGRGTRLFFRLDMPPCLGDEHAANDARPQAEDAGIVGGTVLAVDDNAFYRGLYEDLLQQAGVEPLVAAGIQQALSAAAARPPDVVLMDVDMPGTDGLKAARAIRDLACCRQTPIIALVAQDTAEERTRCLDAGMNDLLVKPVSRRALAGALRKWMPSRSGVLARGSA